MGGIYLIGFRKLKSFCEELHLPWRRRHIHICSHISHPHFDEMDEPKCAEKHCPIVKQLKRFSR
jgi:hypothetical protein